MKNIHKIGKELFITNSEEIKEGDYFIRYLDGKVYKSPIDKEIFGSLNKIILTTDQDLIKDGVQAIDDDFLEWFIKNPSCESVDVKTIDDSGWFYGYKIIIPKQILENYSEKFEEVVKPLMKWLCEKTHPHTTVIVTSNSAELVEGIKSIVTNEFLID